MTELMNVVPCDIIEPSYFGGLGDMSFHIRTVASLDAEMMEFGCGNITPRT